MPFVNPADRDSRRRPRRPMVPFDLSKYPQLAIWDNVLLLRWERLFPEAQA